MSAQTQTWLDVNQQYLSEALAEVRHCLVAHAKKATQQPHPAKPEAAMRLRSEIPCLSPRPAIDELCHLFELSAFERGVLLMCAGMELDSAFGASCAAAQGDPQRGYPTMGLALAALPQPHWSALLPSAPLRGWRLIEFVASGGFAGAPLTTRPIRIDERILHYLTGIQQLDDRLFGLVLREES